MSTIVTINGGDLPSNSRADINTNFSNLNTDKIETSVLDTDTTLAANSDAKIPSQKAVKAYVDTLGNVNASETAKGILEEATDAEVASGASTGGTGAKLAVTPAKLASSRYSPTRSVNAGATISGGTLPVPVYQNKTDNEFYACDGNDTAALKFLGFAISNGTDGNAMTVQFNGVVSGFSGLDEGEKYYVQDTVGTIGTTPGTYEVLVGIAISPTELLIQRGRRYANGVADFTDSGTTGTVSTSVVTLGFRPSLIRATGFAQSPDFYLSSGSWCNGIHKSVRAGIDESGAVSSVTSGSSQILKLTTSAGTDEWLVTITSVTDTGFTISAEQRLASPDPFSMSWEAMGEF